MTNALLTSTILLLAILPITTASGSVEIVVRSPVTVVIEPTVCAEFVCFGADEQTPARKVAAGVPLRFHTARYHGPSLPKINLIMKVIEPASYQLIALEHFRPTADNEFTKMVIPTSLGFNMTVELRNDCAENIYGKRCDRRCIVPDPIQSYCDSDGVLICKTGWTGTNCSEAICPNNCNGRGKCETPGQCQCIAGFTGPNCDKCVPSEGCVHGTCKNDIPGTCDCKPGFAGKFCNVDSHVCSTKKPCQNGGKCSFDANSDQGFRCNCPFEFLGVQCETPLSSVPCSAGSENLCQNGGACYTTKSRHIQCKCRPGFSGVFCQNGIHTDCSSKNCPTGLCRMVHSKPVCIPDPNEHVVTVKDSHSQQQAFDDMHKNLLYIACMLLIIMGLIFALYIIYTRIIRKSTSTAPEDPSPMTTLSKTSSKTPVVYKVCTISEECGGNTSDAELDRFYASPPPAYTSPIVPRYKKIPTDNEVYRDCVV